MTDIVDHARGALLAQPFSMLLGTELMTMGEDEVELCLPIRDELRQQHGFVHGGVISYLADNALTFAGALALGPRVVTGEYKINYLRPAMKGRLLARAKLLYGGRSQATASVTCSWWTARRSGWWPSRRAPSTGSARHARPTRRRNRRPEPNLRASRRGASIWMSKGTRKRPFFIPHPNSRAASLESRPLRRHLQAR